MPKRLAVVVAGAVSLGSFEAGVMYELLDAIGQHNAAVSPADRIEIDVMTGASAGGMTAALAAQKLLYDAPALADPYANDLYRPWVQDIGLDGLLAGTGDDDPTKSVFASSLVDALSRRYMTARYAAGPPPAPRPHPAAAARIRLGLAMSNLNGVDYQRPLPGPDDFVYTRYQDEVRATLEGGAASDTLAAWEPLRAAAVCCGAFPFAFRARDLFRRPADYPPDYLVPFPDPSAFTYTDGGVFQNEPLGLAKDLVDEIDGHEDTEHRFYLFVSPGPRRSTKEDDVHEAGATLKATAVAIVEAIFNQARFQDWITAESVNERIALFDERAEQLRQLMLAGSLDASALAPVVGVLLPALMTASEQQDAEARLKGQYAADYRDLAARASPAVADAWIRGILLLETAADLGPRDEMNIFGITAEAGELASAGMLAFAGFFERRYRDHDYDVGRAKARAAMAAPDWPLGPLVYTPKPIRPIDHALDGLTLDRMDEATRRNLADRLADRTEALLEELGMGGLKRWAIMTFFVRGQIDKLVGLA